MLGSVKNPFQCAMHWGSGFLQKSCHAGWEAEMYGWEEFYYRARCTHQPEFKYPLAVTRWRRS